ncbi:MAG: AbrB/MazE/SpoVT family DNA-binding domain-containing protein [Thermoplasmatales archaeon]
MAVLLNYGPRKLTAKTGAGLILTLPISYQRKMNLHAGDQLLVLEKEDGTLILKPATRSVIS